ncbi:MAG: dTDP-4-dehydrorhamnose reductase, partial [Oscillospiraceae bacterium]|nr:dTDP-4-dehydrorhamnose reductase [Oscillospiraceae bacterium]
TGSNGQLGNELSSILGCGISEIGAISSDYKDCEVIAVDVDRLDITNVNAVDCFVNENHPDVIINCAAVTNVDACETEYVLAMNVNAFGPANLAAAAEKYGAKFVHVSTDYVFSGDGATPYCEWDICGPNTIYGKSKYLGEVYAQQRCSRCFIVRTSWLYGYIGKNFVKTMRRLAKEKGAVTVVNDQRGNPTNANDLAHHILLIALTDNYGIYHCTGKGECSWYDFTKKIVEYSNIPCKLTPCTTDEFPSRTKRPAYSSLRNLSLECTVGDNMRDWEEALKSYIQKLENMEEK